MLRSSILTILKLIFGCWYHHLQAVSFSNFRSFSLSATLLTLNQVTLVYAIDETLVENLGENIAVGENELENIHVKVGESEGEVEYLNVDQADKEGDKEDEDEKDSEDENESEEGDKPDDYLDINSNDINLLKTSDELNSANTGGSASVDDSDLLDVGDQSDESLGNALDNLGGDDQLNEVDNQGENQAADGDQISLLDDSLDQNLDQQISDSSTENSASSVQLSENIDENINLDQKQGQYLEGDDDEEEDDSGGSYSDREDELDESSAKDKKDDKDTKGATAKATSKSTDPKASAKADTKSSAKADAKASSKADAKASPKADTKASAKAGTKASGKADAKASAKADTKSSAKAASKAGSKTASAMTKSSAKDSGRKDFSKSAPKVEKQETKKPPMDRKDSINTGGKPSLPPSLKKKVEQNKSKRRFLTWADIPVETKKKMSQIAAQQLLFSKQSLADRKELLASKRRDLACVEGAKADLEENLLIEDATVGDNHADKLESKVKGVEEAEEVLENKDINKGNKEVIDNAKKVRKKLLDEAQLQSVTHRKVLIDRYLDKLEIKMKEKKQLTGGIDTTETDGVMEGAGTMGKGSVDMTEYKKSDGGSRNNGKRKCGYDRV